MLNHFQSRRFPVLTFAIAVAMMPTLAACPGGGTGPDAGDGVFTWGTVVDLLSGAFVDGADICIVDTENCTEAGTDGTFNLGGLGENEDILVSFDDNRYFPAVGHMNTARTVEFPWNYRLPTDGALELQASLAGESSVERGMGQVFIAVQAETGMNKPRVPGLIFTPSEGSEALGTVVYGNDLSSPDPALTETSSQGVALFSNVPPGIYSFTVTGDDDCQPYFSFDSPDDGLTYPVHVFSNTLSAVTVVCPQD